MSELNDQIAEKTALSVIFKYGKDAMIEASGLLDSRDFYDSTNKKIFAVLKQLDDDPTISEFDIDSFKVKAKSLGFKDLTGAKMTNDYIATLQITNTPLSNLSSCVHQIKKFSIVRELKARHLEAANYLDSITGNEKISEIIT